MIKIITIPLIRPEQENTRASCDLVDSRSPSVNQNSPKKNINLGVYNSLFFTRLWHSDFPDT